MLPVLKLNELLRRFPKQGQVQFLVFLYPVPYCIALECIGAPPEVAHIIVQLALLMSISKVSQQQTRNSNSRTHLTQDSPYFYSWLAVNDVQLTTKSPSPPINTNLRGSLRSKPDGVPKNIGHFQQISHIPSHFGLQHGPCDLHIQQSVFRPQRATFRFNIGHILASNVSD